MQRKTKICVIILTVGGGSRGGGGGAGGHWNIGVGDPTNGSVGFQRLSGERRFVCFVCKQSVWLLEHVTGIAETRSKIWERSWR